MLIDLHDLEGAVGCVEELELFDGALRNRVEGGTTPAPLHQTDGLCCRHTRKMGTQQIRFRKEEYHKVTRE